MNIFSKTGSHNQKSGFSLIELLVYISILTIVAGGSLSFLFSLGDRINEQRANQLVLRSAQTTLERILGDIRSADVIDAFGTTLESNPGSILLVGDATTTAYTLVDEQIVVSVNGGATEPLTDEHISVESMRFFAYDNTVTDMVRVEITLYAEFGDATVRKTFETGAVLRGSYE